MGSTEREAAPKSRPRGVTIAALFYAFLGVTNVLTVIQSNPGGDNNLSLYAGFVMTVMSWGLWKGKGWAWAFFFLSAFALIAVEILSSLTIQLTSIPAYSTLPYFWQVALPVAGVAGIVINLLLIYYMTRQNVRVFFGKASIRDEFL